MAGIPTKITFNGREEEGVVLDIVRADEHFNELHLSDGSVLRTKLVATGVIKLSNLRDNLGYPMYLLQSSNAVSVVSGPTPVEDGAA